MVSKYEIGDTVLLCATIKIIEALPDGRVLYRVNDVGLPALGEDIVTGIEEPWTLAKPAHNVCGF